MVSRKKTINNINMREREREKGGLVKGSLHFSSPSINFKSNRKFFEMQKATRWVPHPQTVPSPLLSVLEPISVTLLISMLNTPPKSPEYTSDPLPLFSSFTHLQFQHAIEK